MKGMRQFLKDSAFRLGCEREKLKHTRSEVKPCCSNCLAYCARGKNLVFKVAFVGQPDVIWEI